MLQKLVSDERTRIAIRSAFLEFAAGVTGVTEVVSKPAAQTPPPTHAGGQDDGSYTNSLKPGSPPFKGQLPRFHPRIIQNGPEQNTGALD